MVWLADDATGAGSLANLRKWWDVVQGEGERYGYFVKPSKSWLILKDSGKLDEAQHLFANSAIQITTAGKRHLGAVIGTAENKTTYMEEKVEEWCNRLKNLANIAKAQPQAAYIAYTHGEQHRYTYFLRTIEGISELFKPLDEVINNNFLPALFGDTNISENERKILSLPVKDGE